MNLEQINEMLEQDIKIDATKLQYEATHNPVVYTKWLRIYSEIKKSLLTLEHNKKMALKQRLDYYTGRGDDVCMTVYDKSELKTVMAADTDVATIDAKIAYTNIMLDTVSKALDAIKSRGFAIKNAIDLRLLEAGK